jgi:hypothetical protein
MCPATTRLIRWSLSRILALWLLLLLYFIPGEIFRGHVDSMLPRLSEHKPSFVLTTHEDLL